MVVSLCEGGRSAFYAFCNPVGMSGDINLHLLPATSTVYFIVILLWYVLHPLMINAVRAFLLKYFRFFGTRVVKFLLSRFDILERISLRTCGAFTVFIVVEIRSVFRFWNVHCGLMRWEWRKTFWVYAICSQFCRQMEMSDKRWSGIFV